MVSLRNGQLPHKCEQFLSMRKIIYSLLFLCCMFPIHAIASPPKEHSLLPTNSVAMSDDALATFFNPAGLGTNRALNLYYLRTYRSDLPGDDAFFISAPGTGFSMEFLNGVDDTAFNRYSLSAGYHFGHAFYWGTNYSWINSDNQLYDKYKSLSVGMMYRRRFFSIGAIGRNLNRPKILNQKLGRTYDFGIALRPGTWRTTLSLDLRKTQGLDEIDLSYAVEIRPIRELILRGTYNSDRSFNIQFGINIGNFGFGSANYFDNHRKQNAGVGYLHFSSASITKPIPRRRIFLDLRLEQLETTLRIAKWDPDVAGVLIRINGNNLGLGRLQEIRDSILDFKNSGKIVISYISICTTGDYTIASLSDAILIQPTGEVRLIGLRSERSFYKDTLDILGIQAYTEYIGEYKSASETFTRSNMSEHSRENMNSILDDLYDQITTDIATTRGMTTESVRKLIDQGPFTAIQANRLKLVDELAYEGRTQAVANKLVGKKVKLMKINEYINSTLTQQDWLTPTPKIAVIEAKGMMLTGESFSDPFTGTKVMGADTIARAISYTRKNDAIKAVVLRIDSPGGLVVAADKIWNELVALTVVKPLIVSMGDVAASGGYYIAAPADVIVAEPGTITGSIGVIYGTYNFKGLYDKLGIKKEIITRGKHADFYSDYTEYSITKQENLKKQVQETYNEFIAKVARGRSTLTTEEVDKVARGRVWTGRQAKEKGLVDELGGLNEALIIAQQRAGLDNKVIEIVRLPKTPWLPFLLGNIQSALSPKQLPLQHAFQHIGRHLFGETYSYKLINILKQHRAFLLFPYDIKVTQ